MDFLRNINTQMAPFSFLDEQELSYLQDNVDIHYFQEDEVIITSGGESRGMHLIIKGRVTELEKHAEDVGQYHALMQYGPEEYFGSWSAIRGHSLHDFIATEETICYLLPSDNLRQLIYQNPTFGEYFSNPSVQRDLLENSTQGLDMTEFMLATVDASCMRPALLIDSKTNLRDTFRQMREQHSNSVLVKRGKRFGMVTRTDLLDALILQEHALTTMVGDIANYRLVTVDNNDYLLNALVLMTEHDIERVVVLKKGELAGIVELAEALSFISSQSHVVGIRIERAGSINELREVAKDMEPLIRSLYTQGVKIRFLMDLLAALNKRLMAKLFHIMVPEDVIPHVCLVVMGSEGRGEQITKTDQDNGLIMRDGLDWSQGHSILQKYTQILGEIGFPSCPGNIMVSNSFWVQPISEWTKRMQEWVVRGDSESLMNLAVAVDASPVAGNAALYKTSRNWFLKEVQQHKSFLPAFAEAAMVFDTPLTFMGNIWQAARGVDLKRGGVFPIVQGVRTLALDYQIVSKNTYARIDTLITMEALPAKLGQELQEAFSVFHWLRLKEHLVQETPASHQTKQDNLIYLDNLNSLEKNSLRQAFHVVKSFKRHLKLKYQLGSGLS